MVLGVLSKGLHGQLHMQKIPEQHTGKARIKETTKKNRHRAPQNTSEGATVKL